MNKGTKNNSFTDALGEEISSRKIFEKAAQKKEEEKLFLSEFEEDLIADPIEVPEPVWRRSAPPRKSKPKQKKVAEKKSQPAVSKTKKISPPKKISASAPPKKEKISPPVAAVELKAEDEFERRIFAEADNDFFDEKIPESIGDNMRSKVPEKNSRRSAFRSKTFNPPLEEEKSSEQNPAEENSPDFDPELYRKLTRTEISGVAISAIMLVYAFVNLDKPLFFLALSLFTHLMRPFIGSLCGKYNRPVQNALRSFSLVLFVGAIIILFTLS